MGAVIDLGLCLDLLDSEYLQLAKRSYQSLVTSYKLLDIMLSANMKPGLSKEVLIRKLDCAVIENLHRLRKKKKTRPFNSARGVFIEGAPLYPDAGFNEKKHIQIGIQITLSFFSYPRKKT